MGFGRGGDGHGLNRLVPQHFTEGAEGAAARVLLRELLQGFVIAVADGRQRPEIVKIADQVLAPVAGADDGHTRHGCRREIARHGDTVLGLGAES